MATQVPLTSPWLITLPDTNEHTLDMSSLFNGKIHPQLGLKIVFSNFSAPTQFRVVQVGAAADLVDANNASYTTTDPPVPITIHSNQEIRVVGSAAATFQLST